MELPSISGQPPHGLHNYRALRAAMLAAMDIDGRITLHGVEYQLLSVATELWDGAVHQAEFNTSAGIEVDPEHMAPWKKMRNSGAYTFTISVDGLSTIFNARRIKKGEDDPHRIDT